MPVRKVALVMVATFLSSIVLTSCSSQASVKEVTISQDDVSSLTIPTTAEAQKKRVVALANGSAEIIAALGYQKLIVGRDIASTEKAFDQIPIVASGHQIIPEKVIALRPDLVLIDASSGPARAIEAIRASGIAVVTIREAWTLADIAGKVSDIATALGVSAAGDLFNAEMQRALSDVQRSTSARIAFLYLRGTNSIYLMGGPGSGADSLIAAVGSRDVGAENLKNPFTALTAEELVKANPEIILVMTNGLKSVGGVNGLFTLPGVAQTDAGKEKRVIDVDDSLLLSFGPRTPDLLRALAQAIAEVQK